MTRITGTDLIKATLIERNSAKVKFSDTNLSETHLAGVKATETNLAESNLTSYEDRIHRQALDISRRYHKTEVELILILQEVESSKLYRKLEFKSLFEYSVHMLGLSRDIAYSFIAVARKSREIKEFKEAVLSQELSVSKAAKIVSVLKIENASKLLEFAKTHTSREIEKKVVEINPKKSFKTQVKYLSPGILGLNLCVQESFYTNVKRIQSLESQRLKKAVSIEEALEASVETHLKVRDPVERAKRVQQRPAVSAQSEVRSEMEILSNKEVARSTNKTQPEKFVPGRKNLNSAANRIPFKASEKHAVNSRDQGRCTHIDSKGNRCNEDKWIALHHIQPVSLGGTNSPENLTTLCSFHHDLVHQLSLPIEGQSSWIRSPTRSYGSEPDQTRTQEYLN